MNFGRKATMATMRRLTPVLALAALCGSLSACSSVPEESLPTVDYVGIERFMGDWYVVADNPTLIE